MNFRHIVKLDTHPGSIFYSIIQYEDKWIGFGRKHHNQREIIQITLNDQFDIVERDDTTFKGEDPRCFKFNHQLFIQDNYLNDMYLILYDSRHDSNTYIKINISGKNLSFFEHRGQLYFIHYIKPFALYILDVLTGNCTKVDVDDDGNDHNYEYRGGTPGYPRSENSYYGFGHRTYYKDETLTHDIFQWILYFEEGKLPRIDVTEIPQPLLSRNICDPTCVIEINNKKYMVTAESDYEWFSDKDQDFSTNVYEIT